MNARAREWLGKAAADLETVALLLSFDAFPRTVAAFHCQQAVEKALKGYLIKRTGKMQQGHNLLRLLQRAAQFNNTLYTHAKNVSFLNEYYVETRYPAEEPLLVRVEDVEECMRIMDAMMSELKPTGKP